MENYRTVDNRDSDMIIRSQEEELAALREERRLTQAKIHELIVSQSELHEALLEAQRCIHIALEAME